MMPLYVSKLGIYCRYCGGVIRFPIGENNKPIRVGCGILGECEVCGSQFRFSTKKKEGE